MLKLSNRTSYGVRALVDLARRRAESEAPVSLSGISSRQGIPQPFLEQIFALLRRAGIVEAVRGAYGGYRFKRPPENVTVSDVVEALEGPLGPALCVMPENFSPDCHVVEKCFSRAFCDKLDGGIQQVLQSTTIGGLAQESDRLAAQPV